MGRRFFLIRTAVLGRPHRTNGLAVVYLAGLLAFAIYYLGPSLFRSWCFSSDEYVFAAEVIRFLHLDFRQQFFDIPGTPFMFLSAAIWALIYSAQGVLRLIPPSVGIEHFTFDHLPALFTMMRTLTLFCFLCSIILLFILAARLTNKAGAAVASLLLLMSPTYTSYSSFVRTESLSVCLILISILCLLRGLEGRSQPGHLRYRALRILFAGVLAGLAAASRLHTITAALPLLLLLLLSNNWDPCAYPRWLALSWKWIIACVFTFSCAAVLAIDGGYLPHSAFGQEITHWYPNAFSSLYLFLLLLIGAYVTACILYRLSRTRPLVDRFLHPTVLLLLSGCAAGFLIATPPIIWQYRYFLQSVQMYNTMYLDYTRINLPLFKNFLWVVKFYVPVIAPDNLSLLLLAIGVLTVLVKRDYRLLPFVVSGFLFFISKPINLRAWPHHVIPWLPFWSIVAGYPVAQAYEALSNRFPRQYGLNAASLVVLLGILAFVTIPGPIKVAGDTRRTEERMKNIALATDWIKINTELDAPIAVSYYCFNSDVFLVWLRALDVSVPKYAFDGRRYMIWWGERSALKGLKGYACASPRDLDAIKFRLDLASPGEGTDPYTDKQFQSLKAFGIGENEVNIFAFDFRQS